MTPPRQRSCALRWINKTLRQRLTDICMQALYDLPAPAKLNLFLHITGRRADGYHLLQSAFMLVDWCDSLDLELRASGTISREDLQDDEQQQDKSIALQEVLPSEDLCVRAARALQAATGTAQGVHIRLRKRIPTQAGMGGGSSDAATCLLGLNRLWNLQLNRAQLQQIGLQLGADVPFFLSGGHAWVQGIGELLTPITLPPARFVVCKPPTGVSTPAIFTHSALDRNCAHAIISGFAATPYDFGRNVLQPVAELINPQVTQALNALRQQGLSPRMTGSGSAVFARVSGDEKLAAVPPGWQQNVCSNLSVHPLAEWAL
jgi:4-diphosphocytidyl-2-C-methyl-D-erythritol kinase